MKILIAHNYYQQPGGEDQCVAAEAALLRAQGHEVIKYSLHNDSISELGRFQVASRTIWSQPAYQEMRALIRARRPQIVHFHNTFPLISPAAYYAARAENVRVVQTLHNFRLLCPNAIFFRAGRVCEDCLGRSIPWPGVVHKCYRDSRAASATAAVMLTAHRAVETWHKAVDVFIALTQFSRDKFIQGRLPAGKIAVKPNFVYPDPGLGAGTGKYGLFVGRLSAEKGLDTLLKAWAILRENVPLKIVGDGPLAAMVEEAAANDSRIEWLGRKPAEEVHALIGEARFLLCPSSCYENFPMVIVEAFAKGTPVIASDLGAMAEVVGHGRTGLRFGPGGASDLASTVQDLSADLPALSRMRQAARKEYDDKYTVESNYRLLAAIYERVLGSPIEVDDSYEPAEVLATA
jgi:glycosyltransferase involved in cell wall biosynthesis